MRELLRRATDSMKPPMLALPAPCQSVGADAAVCEDVLDDGGDGAAAGAAPVSCEVASAVEASSGLCLARTWNAGAGAQCKRQRLRDTDFCKKHGENLKHGRIDEALPASMERLKPKALRRNATRDRGRGSQATAASQGTAVSESVAAASGSAGSSDGVKRQRIESSGTSPLPATWVQPASLSGRNRSSSLLQRRPATGDALSQVLQQWRRTARPIARDPSFASQLRLHLDDWLYQRGVEESMQSNKEKAALTEASQAIVCARLRRLGLDREYTPPHGNCQFIAICRALGFPDEGHHQVRKEVCDYLDREVKSFEAFAGLPWGVYIRGLRGSEFGDHITLLAAARIFNRSFDVVTDDPNNAVLNIVAPEANPLVRPAVLAHYGEWHYESTRPLESVENVG